MFWLQAEIVCGDANQAWYFICKINKTQRTYTLGNTHPEPLNGLVNAVACFEVARLNKGNLCVDRFCMEYTDNNAYDIVECPDSDDDTWDCFSYSSFHMAKEKTMIE